MDEETGIIVDGAMLYAGHRWAWRRGIILGTTPRGWYQVRLERRGRERKRPEAEMPAWWLYTRTAELESRLDQVGVLAGHDDAELQGVAYGMARFRAQVDEQGGVHG